MSSHLHLFCFAAYKATDCGVSCLELEPTVMLTFSLTTVRTPALLKLKSSEVTKYGCSPDSIKDKG